MCHVSQYEFAFVCFFRIFTEKIAAGHTFFRVSKKIKQHKPKKESFACLNLIDTLGLDKSKYSLTKMYFLFPSMPIKAPQINTIGFGA